MRSGASRARGGRAVPMGPTFLEANAIAARVRELGAEISGDYTGEEILLVGMLKGSVFFLADLARAIDIPLEIDFLSLSSYHRGARGDRHQGYTFPQGPGPTGQGQERHHRAGHDRFGAHAALHLSLARPAAAPYLEACILFDRPQLRLVDLDVRYRGFEVPDDFFVGYGFDYQQLFRNLPYVAYLKTSPISRRSSKTAGPTGRCITGHRRRSTRRPRVLGLRPL